VNKKGNLSRRTAPSFALDLFGGAAVGIIIHGMPAAGEAARQPAGDIVRGGAGRVQP
jgi:hypothetical protein